MLGDTHVWFGGRARETDPGQPGHRARARPNRSDTAAIMSNHWRLPISAGQHGVRVWNPTGFSVSRVAGVSVASGYASADRSDRSGQMGAGLPIAGRVRNRRARLSAFVTGGVQ